LRLQPEFASVFALITDGRGVEGGIARYNVALLSALSASSRISVVTVLARRAVHSLPVEGSKVHYLRSGASKAKLVAATIKQSLAGDHHDIVFCGHLNMVPLAWILARRWRAKLWVQMHGIECWQRPREHIRALVEQADLVTCVSRYTRRRVLEWCDIEPAKVRVLPNTLSEQFDTPSLPRKAGASQTQCASRSLSALTVARLSASERYKGHDVMIRALALLGPSVRNVKYVIAGDGDDRPRLETLVWQLGLVDCVSFVGRVDEAGLPALYDAADVFVMPSTGEGFGIVFLEAQQRGCTVIASSADGAADPLRDGADGYLVEPNDPQALANLLRSLAQSGISPRLSSNVFSKRSFDRHVHRLLHLLA
jgi:phosphatidyl-myo-inositol dimannoside synthase